MFMQLWSPTVIYPFIQNIQAGKTRSSTRNGSPEKLVGVFFKMFDSRSSSLHQRSKLNLGHVSSNQKSRCHSCKQTIYHSTTTVPSSEISTFVGIAGPTSCIKFPVQLFVVLYWGNRQSFLFPEKRTFEKTQNCGQRF